MFTNRFNDIYAGKSYSQIAIDGHPHGSSNHAHVTLVHQLLTSTIMQKIVIRVCDHVLIPVTLLLTGHDSLSWFR